MIILKVYIIKYIKISIYDCEIINIINNIAQSPISDKTPSYLESLVV